MFLRGSAHSAWEKKYTSALGLAMILEMNLGCRRTCCVSSDVYLFVDVC